MRTCIIIMRQHQNIMKYHNEKITYQKTKYQIKSRSTMIWIHPYMPILCLTINRRKKLPKFKHVNKCLNQLDVFLATRHKNYMCKHILWRFITSGLLTFVFVVSKLYTYWDLAVSLVCFIMSLYWDVISDILKRVELDKR